MKTSFRSLLESTVQQQNSRRFLLRLLTLMLLTAIFRLPVAAAGATYYVDAAATGSATGDSWVNAFTNLQDALHVATSGDEIWVAKGVYYPDVGGGKTDNDRNASFAIPSGVKLYGGFAGAETALEGRDWRRHVTVLSGDIDENDKTTVNYVVESSSNISGSNSLHVVYLDGTTNAITDTTRIDGFVITAGQANGTGKHPDMAGAGLFCYGYTKGECSPSLVNVIFSGNFAGSNGGALFNDGTNGGKSSPTLSSVLFRGNRANSGGGGAIYNAAWDNGNSSPTLTNVIFSGNSAGWAGGALFNQGERNGNSSPVLTNVTFSGNSAATFGGALFNYGGNGSPTGSSNPVLKNVILWENSAPAGPSIYNNYSKSSISHSIVENGIGSITGTITSSVTYDSSNLQSDPRFVQPVAPASAPTAGGDLRLQPESPAINAGDNSAIPAGITTDVAGNQRIVNGSVDIGAYESQANELILAAPEQLPGLIANLEATLQPVVYYTGYDELAFSLTESPDNMTIDLNTGLIRWTPQEADEGNSYPVTVVVNDGSRFAETSFQATVMAPEPVTIVITDNVLTVVDPSTTLNGMSITQLDGDPILASLKLGKLKAGVAPATPAWVSLLSDVFVVRGSFDADIELRFPLASLPPSVARGDVDLYAFAEAEDVEGQFWAPVWMGVEYEETTGSPIIVVELAGLEGMAAWGYDASPDESSTSIEKTRDRFASRGIGLAAPFPQPATCTVQGQPQDDMYICRTSEVTVTIRGWGTGATRWTGGQANATGVTKETLMSWLLDAQRGFSATHLGFENTFNVAIETMNSDGFVRGGAEKYRTLHLNNSNSRTASQMQATAAHEYFHHAQAHSKTKDAGKDLLNDGGYGTSWMIEGTAVWFEDYLYDALNEYIQLEGRRGHRIAEAGIDSYDDDTGGVKRSYQRFSFFKLLTQACPNFVNKFRDGMNVNLSTDPSGIANLTSLFGSNGFNCNFGNHLGSEHASSLAAALAYYNYATQFKNNIALLDANEPYSATNPTFNFVKPDYQFSPQPTTVDEWLALPNSTITLTIASHIPAAGAYSFKVPAVAGNLPNGKVAELRVVGSRPITVSLTGMRGQFTGTNTIGAGADLAPHTWFTTTEKSGYVYSANGKAPELFVTLVNASLTEKVDAVKVTLRLRDASLPEVSISAPQNGAPVSSRVITLTGVIPEAARTATKNVVVTANGIPANTPIQANGAFTAQVVVAFGQNSIEVQGMGNGTPTTEEKVITVQGVANLSGERNALIDSRVVFVLRWNTPGTDVDIYTTDKAGASVWYKNLKAPPGILDFDDTDGFGPEVISYRATDDALYVDGSFDLDIHYYAGSPPTNFTLDVILNETEPANRLVRQYRSAQPLVTSDSNQDGPDGSGASRFNNILRITCSQQRVCNVASVNSAHLISSGDTTAP